MIRIIICMLFITLIGKYSFSQQNMVEAEGIVTYFHNENFGFRPDTNTKVYFRPAVEADTLKDYFAKRRFFEMMVNTTAITSKYAKPKPSHKTDIDSLQYYNRVTDRILDELNDKAYRTTVDGVGRFKIKVPAGFYEAIIISSNKSGRKLNRFIYVEPNKPLYIDFEFDRI